jgi:hypothetical protein
MDSSTTKVSPEAFERLFKEYQICHEQASRLESHIWQTATLFGVGSAIGLVSLASKEPDWVKTLVAAILAIIASLVWLRFAGRWWSIQRLKFERMDEIDKQIGFRQNIIVGETDIEAQSHRRYLQKHGRFPRRKWNQHHLIPGDVPARFFFEETTNIVVSSQLSGSYAIRTLSCGSFSLLTRRSQNSCPTFVHSSATSWHWRFSGVL